MSPEVKATIGLGLFVVLFGMFIVFPKFFFGFIALLTVVALCALVWLFLYNLFSDEDW